MKKKEDNPFLILWSVIPILIGLGLYILTNEINYMLGMWFIAVGLYLKKVRK